MKKYYKNAILSGLIGLNISCSDNIGGNAIISGLENQVFLENDSNDIKVISSMEEFYQFLSEKSTFNSLKKKFISESYVLDSRATISSVTVTGYKGFNLYAGCKDIRVYFSDYQTADKLGIVAHKTYYMSIGLANYIFPLESNWRPGIAESLECGIILGDDPKNDDFVNAPRGYVGSYNAQKSQYLMNTSLVYFVDEANNPDRPKIWYPCSPDKLKWKVNILKL